MKGRKISEEDSPLPGLDRNEKKLVDELPKKNELFKINPHEYRMQVFVLCISLNI